MSDGASKGLIESPDPVPETPGFEQTDQGPDPEAALVASLKKRLTPGQRAALGEQILKIAQRIARAIRPQKRRGRPPLDSVTQAIRLRRKGRSWGSIYPSVIPGYLGLESDERRAKQHLLRDRVRSRLSQQLRRSRERLNGS